MLKDSDHVDLVECSLGLQQFFLFDKISKKFHRTSNQLSISEINLCNMTLFETYVLREHVGPKHCTIATSHIWWLRSAGEGQSSRD